MTILLRFYLKLDSQALTLCVQMSIFALSLDGRTVTSRQDRQKILDREY